MCVQYVCISMSVCVCACVCVCVCVCVYVCVCVCVWVCGCVRQFVFKNGKGSFTQCILVHMDKGV